LSVREILNELKAKYKVDEFFYPNISMNIQVPGGLEGEISDISRVLKSSGFEITATNVLQVMELKKKLLTKYTSEAERQKILADYQELLATRVKPVGTVLPLELILVNGLVIILLSMVAKFGLSFADEAGKILARKVFDEDKKQSKKLNMTEDEYRFLKTEAKVWIDTEGNKLVEIKKSSRVRKKSKSKSNKK